MRTCMRCAACTSSLDAGSSRLDLRGPNTNLRRSISSTACAARCRTSARSPIRRVRRDSTVPSTSVAIHTVPTGFSSVPPPGPATPVIAIPTRAPVAARTPVAIARTTGSLTAPCSRRSSFGTPSSSMLHVVRVRDHATQHDVARAGNRGEARAEQAAGAALGDARSRARARDTDRARRPRDRRRPRRRPRPRRRSAIARRTQRAGGRPLRTPRREP